MFLDEATCKSVMSRVFTKGGKSTRIFYSSKSTVILKKLYSCTSKITSFQHTTSSFLKIDVKLKGIFKLQNKVLQHVNGKR